MNLLADFNAVDTISDYYIAPEIYLVYLECIKVFSFVAFSNRRMYQCTNVLLLEICSIYLTHIRKLKLVMSFLYSIDVLDINFSGTF